jgi:hypothetical protein
MGEEEGGLMGLSGGEEGWVIADIVVGIEVLGGEDEANGAGGEIADVAPDHGTEVEAEVGAIELVTDRFATVIEEDVEAAGEGDDELMEVFVGMAAAFGAARDVVEVVDATDWEGNVTVFLDEGEVAAGIGDFWEFDDPTGVDAVDDRVLAWVHAGMGRLHKVGHRSAAAARSATQSRMPQRRRCWRERCPEATPMKGIPAIPAAA